MVRVEPRRCSPRGAGARFDVSRKDLTGVCSVQRDFQVAPKKAIAAFSLAYEDQNEKDHAARTRAVRSGKVNVNAVFEEDQ